MGTWPAMSWKMSGESADLERRLAALEAALHN